MATLRHLNGPKVSNCLAYLREVLEPAVPDKALAGGFQFDHPDLAPALQNVLAQ